MKEDCVVVLTCTDALETVPKESIDIKYKKFGVYDIYQQSFVELCGINSNNIFLVS